MLGPWAVRALKNRHDILLTDINERHPDYKGDYLQLSVADVNGVIKAAEDMDVIVNLSVLRPHRQFAFDVNTMGNYAMMVAAREHGIKRVINSGPHYQMAGEQRSAGRHSPRVLGGRVHQAAACYHGSRSTTTTSLPSCHREGAVVPVWADLHAITIVDQRCQGVAALPRLDAPPGI